jgi:uncharacterized membrane protein
MSKGPIRVPSGTCSPTGSIWGLFVGLLLTASDFGLIPGKPADVVISTHVWDSGGVYERYVKRW